MPEQLQVIARDMCCVRFSSDKVCMVAFCFAVKPLGKLCLPLVLVMHMAVSSEHQASLICQGCVTACGGSTAVSPSVFQAGTPTIRLVTWPVSLLALGAAVLPHLTSAASANLTCLAANNTSALEHRLRSVKPQSVVLQSLMDLVYL